ncbi:hypothetical protein [Aurantivibrio infirmus]
MNVIDIGAQHMIDKIGLSTDASTVGKAMRSLFDDSDGKINFGDFAVKIAANKNISCLLKTWLQEGGDHSISASDIMSIFGPKKIAYFADQLHIDPPSAALGLACALPKMMIKNNSENTNTNKKMRCQ